MKLVHDQITVPPGLLHAIREGSCVAFLGAGFSAAAKLPSWEALLIGIAKHELVPCEVREYALDRLKGHRSDWNEEVAEMLRDVLRNDFVEVLGEQLQGFDLDGEMSERLELLRGIPFRAVLTTNFDDILSGLIPGPEAYNRFLTRDSRTRSLFARGLEHGGFQDRSPVIKLHGDLSDPNSIVFSRLDYRKRLFSDAGYLNFLKSLFMFNTVLYLGFSFTDAYINQLRSEMLAMLGEGSRDRPLAYAVLADLPEITRRHFERIEGIQVIHFETAGGSDFSEFKRILRAIHDSTNPLMHFGQMLAERRILWVDPNPRSVAPVTQRFLVNAARKAGDVTFTVDHVSTAKEAVVALMRSPPHHYSLIVSHWGHSVAGGPTAVQLLQGIRDHRLEVPLLVFATDNDVDERKQTVQRLGGQGYYWTYDGLLRGMEHVFAPAAVSG
jgi:hypothetical protein